MAPHEPRHPQSFAVPVLAPSALVSPPCASSLSEVKTIGCESLPTADSVPPGRTLREKPLPNLMIAPGSMVKELLTSILQLAACTPAAQRVGVVIAHSPMVVAPPRSVPPPPPLLPPEPALAPLGPTPLVAASPPFEPGDDEPGWLQPKDSHAEATSASWTR